MSKRNMQLSIHRVTGDNLGELKKFLELNGLPHEDIRLDGNEFFLYFNGDTLVGSGGLEFYGDYCLLRSVAVASEFRGSGCGQEIAHDLIDRASSRRSRSISLLTETAPLFFEKLGFAKQSRDEAPKEIKSSSEFSSVCPVSAALMTLSVAKG